MQIKADRLEVLHDVLLYCSTEQGYGRPSCFDVFERMNINQERGALLSQLNQESQDNEIRYCQCSPELENKIQHIIKKSK
jgi:hypothetical protein